MKTPLTVEIPLGDRAYQAWVGPGLLSDSHLARALDTLEGRRRGVIISDSTVAPLYGQRVLQAFQNAGRTVDLLTVPAGEASKSMGHVESLCRQMIDHGCDRHAFVVALGGGVIGDLAGFVAGVFYRGLPYIQIPTTIVSQVDSSVGGKTGVNTPEGKNLIGLFHQPRLVVADTETLDTLPDREFREGFAEVIKHAAIRDAGMIPLIESVASGDRAGLPQLMARNMSIKAAIVGEDERETGEARALLNFGHTIGHAIEAAAGYGKLLHGEAISLGLIAAARLSCQFAGLPSSDSDRLHALLHRFHLPVTLPIEIREEDILRYMTRDKKFEQGHIRFVLLRALGDAFVSRDVTIEAITQAVRDLRD